MKLKTIFKKPGALTIFLAIFGIYLGTAPHSFLHTDGAIRELVAENLLQGELALVQIDTGEIGANRGTAGKDGRMYSYYAIGQSLLEMPFIAANKWVATTGRLGQSIAGLFSPMIMLMALTGALIPTLAYLLLRELGYTPRSALLTAFVIAFGTILWVVSGHTHNSVQTTMGIFGSMTFILIAQNKEKNRSLHYLIAGAFLGVSFITRVSAVIAGPSLAILVLFRGEDRTLQEHIKDAIWFGLGFTLIGWVQLAYNYVRFETLFKSGYENRTPDFMPPNFIKGLSWFVSPWRGMLIYTPVLWLVPFAIGKAYKKHRVMVISLLVLFVTYVVFYSSLTPLRAFWGWGSYYLMPAFLSILLPIAELFENWTQHKKWQRGLIVGVIVLSIAVQLTTISVPVERHIIELGLEEPTLDLNGRLWTVRHNPLVANAKTTVRNFMNLLSDPQPYLDPPSSSKDQVLLDELYEFNLPDWQWLYQWLRGSQLAILVPLYALISLTYIGMQLGSKKQPEDDPGDMLSDSVVDLPEIAPEQS
ncbi:MAG: glycosyltransferase family 39 protein [Anaerolineae bacterium]|nr:glycosyltransferase family 39 protein [Anaerolineae bacterium]